MQRSVTRLTLALTLAASAAHAQQQKLRTCTGVSFEGEVHAGEPYRREFTPGLELFLEPLPSGWIVRVLPIKSGREVRSTHDWAEVATPPFRSPNPLLISTDWSFRAQDAAGWNPREFRYAKDAATFAQMSALEDAILASQPGAEAKEAALMLAQPEARIELLDVSLVPGVNNQAQMASMVAQHFEQTPHEVVQGAAPSPLGHLDRIRFRATLVLPAGHRPSPGLESATTPCPR